VQQAIQAAVTSSSPEEYASKSGVMMLWQSGTS
jgi:hypothetical protein